nr:MAG TPA_asm: hypothetical protein [Bacteriophage sp.]
MKISLYRFRNTDLAINKNLAYLHRQARQCYPKTNLP